MQGRSAAVMEIGGRRCHVAQARHAQDFGLRRSERMKDAVPLEQVTADIDTLVTRYAAERLEQLVAVLLLRRQRRAISGEPTVEPTPRCHERPLVGSDRIQETC